MHRKEPFVAKEIEQSVFGATMSSCALIAAAWLAICLRLSLITVVCDCLSG